MLSNKTSCSRSRLINGSLMFVLRVDGHHSHWVVQRTRDAPTLIRRGLFWSFVAVHIPCCNKIANLALKTGGFPVDNASLYLPGKVRWARVETSDSVADPSCWKDRVWSKMQRTGFGVGAVDVEVVLSTARAKIKVVSKQTCKQGLFVY